ncbi:MAG: ATP-binding protein [Candidatus Omnitrophota bacterium]|jgi:tRNA 2-thiocytidine biosynthesis protein TtcA
MRDLTGAGVYISNRIGKAIADYNMIEDGDKILVAISGGKDSFALLKLLNERKKWAPVKYEIIAIHVVSDYKPSKAVSTAKLKKFFKDNKIKYCIEKIKLLNKEGRMSCFWCSWNRRKAIFLAAKRLGCTKVALGHHQDDIIETLLLNMVYHGEFSAMNPRQELFGGKIVLIRPLCYVEERYMKKFAKESCFPAETCTCPYSETSKRRMMKNFVNEAEKKCKYVRKNIFRSISRINKEYTQIHPEQS